MAYITMGLFEEEEIDMATIPTEKECLIRNSCVGLARDIAEVLARMSESELNNSLDLEIVEIWCETFEDNNEWLTFNRHLGIKKVKREFITKLIDKVVNEYGR